MDARLYILTVLNDLLRRMDLDDLGAPTWNDGRFVRACMLRLARGHEVAWDEFLQRLGSDRDLLLSVRDLLIYAFIVRTLTATNDVEVDIPPGIAPLSNHDHQSLIELLSLRPRNRTLYPHPLAHFAPDAPHLYTSESDKKFIPPLKE